MYSPLKTTLEDFERMHLLSGEALERATTLRGVELKSFMPHAELTGFRQAARLAADVTTVPLESSLAVPGGPLTRACFEELAGRLLSRLEDALPVDGVYLALHGSMQVDGLAGAPEANLLRRVRALVGEGVKIAVSYDLHANLSAGLVDPVDVLVAYRTNPHWDLAPTGFRAGRRLIRTIRGDTSPVHAWRKLPMVLGGGTTIDFLQPMRAVFRAMKKLERDARVVSASLFMVHPYTDAEELGWEELWSLPDGTRRHVTLRGTPGYAMPQVALDAVVARRATTDSGRLVRLDVGNTRVVVSDRPPLPIHPSFWSSVGLSARRADLIVQKNFFHYRMFYLTISLHHIPVVSGGATSLDLVRERARAARAVHAA